jgi:predicted nucleic acid-binding protein
MRIYLDSAPLIYMLERVEPYASRILAFLDRTGQEVICGEITRLECRLRPIRDGDVRILRIYDSYFDLIDDQILPLDRLTIDRATHIRAQYGFRIPDALHIASALSAGCDLFLTNDRQLLRCKEIPMELVETLSGLGPTPNS